MSHDHRDHGAHAHSTTSGHGHRHDRGLRAFLGYLRLLPKMWRSEVSDEVVRTLAPKPGERLLDLGAGMARVMKPGGRVLLVDEDFGDPTHPGHPRSKAGPARHRHVFEAVDVDELAAALLEAGFATAQGSRTTIAGRPAKVVRGIR